MRIDGLLHRWVMCWFPSVLPSLFRSGFEHSRSALCCSYREASVASVDHSHPQNSSLPSFLMVYMNVTGLNAPNLDSDVLFPVCDHRTPHSQGHSLPTPPPRMRELPLCVVLGRRTRARSRNQANHWSDHTHSKQGDLCGGECFLLCVDCFFYGGSGCGDSLFPAPSFRLWRRSVDHCPGFLSRSAMLRESRTASCCRVRGFAG
jgi:hypothetical protein